MTAPPWPAGDYETEPPSVTLLLCRAAPASGGLTTFVDTVQAADALTVPDRALAEALTVVRFGRQTPAPRIPLAPRSAPHASSNCCRCGSRTYSPNGGWAAAAKNTAPLLRPHPFVPGRRALQVSHLQTEWIDVQVSTAGTEEGESGALHSRIISVRDRVLELATRAGSPMLYEHQYSVGDLVSTAHRRGYSIPPRSTVQHCSCLSDGRVVVN